MDKYDKATLILESRQVKIDSVSSVNTFFHIKDYLVRWDKVKNQWSCTCPNYPMRPDIECSHIMAGKMFTWEGKNDKNQKK